MGTSLLQQDGSRVTADSAMIFEGRSDIREDSVYTEKPFVVACIPAFNEEDKIAKIVLTARKFVDKVIVCDDGSSDFTGEIARSLGAEVIRHRENDGYGASLRSLFERVRKLHADVMVTLDADGQHSPGDIPRLVKPILIGKADIVIGSRFLSGDTEKHIPSYRRNGIKLITDLTRSVSFKDITDSQCGYRAYNRKALSFVEPSEYGMGASTEILLKAKEHSLKVVEVPVNVIYEKKSIHNPVVHGVGVILSIIKSLSIKRPLLFYGIPGILSLVVAMGFWVWCFQTFSLTRQLSTNVTLIAVVATIVGLIMLTTAILLWVLIAILRENSR